MRELRLSAVTRNDRSEAVLFASGGATGATGFVSASGRTSCGGSLLSGSLLSKDLSGTTEPGAFEPFQVSCPGAGPAGPVLLSRGFSVKTCCGPAGVSGGLGRIVWSEVREPRN